MNKNNIIIGSGGHTRVVLESAILQKINIIKIIDINKTASKNEKLFGVPISNDLNEIYHYNKDKISLFISIGDCLLRKKYFNFFLKKKYNFLNVIHPECKISNSAELGSGIFVNSNAVINAQARIDDNTIINTSAIIEHESIIGKHTHIGPGSIICGRTEVKDEAFIGAGSILLPKITVGKKTIIGAGSILIKNASSNGTYVGSPANKIN